MAASPVLGADQQGAETGRCTFWGSVCVLAAGRSNKDCYTRWLRYVRPAMLKAAEHLKAKKAAEAAANAKAAAASEDSKPSAQTEAPLETVQARAGQAKAVTEPTEVTILMV